MGRYEDICAEHVWRVPERYNIAADCCDKHPRDKPAMVHERFDGVLRELTWGELQDLSNQAANLLEAHGVERGDRVAVVLPPTPETAAIFFGTWKLGGILLSMSVLYGDDGIAHRLNDSEPTVLVTDAANAPRFAATSVPVLTLTPELLAEHSTEHATADTSADDPRSSTTPPARPGSRRASSRPPLSPRARGVRLLARGRGRRAVPRDGRVGVGRGDRAAARPVAARRAAVRLPA